MRLSRDLEQALREKREMVETCKMEVIAVNKKLSDAEKATRKNNQQMEKDKKQLLLKADEERQQIVQKCQVSHLYTVDFHVVIVVYLWCSL